MQCTDKVWLFRASCVRFFESCQPEVKGFKRKCAELQRHIVFSYPSVCVCVIICSGMLNVAETCKAGLTKLLVCFLNEVK